MNICFIKMCSECWEEKDFLLATSAATIAFLSTVLVQTFKKEAEKILDSSYSSCSQKIQCDGFYGRFNLR